ncbi:MAG: glycosyltransferase family 4 protein [Anaerolineae bacterium]|nr:glycosyltransferase family 4 protein [Anaerolineae bacterium]
MHDALRLFIASGIVHPEPGGPATYLHRLLPELQARGWQVSVVSYSDDRPVEAYPYPIQRIPRRALPLRWFDYARAARPLLKWADVVYLHTLGLPLLGDRRAPRVVKIVGDQGWERAIRKGWVAPMLDVDEYQRAALPPPAAADRAARAREASALDGVIVPSEYLKRMVVGWGVDPAKIQVIYNALPPEDRRAPSHTQRDARAAFDLPQNAPIFLTVGRLVAWKGVDHLIAALRRVKDAHLVVAGEGPLLESLKAAAADLAERVYFLGRVSRERMPLLMRAADYLVLYSGYEGLSHTLLESLAVGTPVIASDKGGNPEVVQHGVNGLLAPYVDIEALAAALTEALQPGKRAALAANAPVGMERFDFTRMIAATDGALRAYAAR